MIARSRAFCLLFVLLLIATSGSAQQFSHQGTLGTVPSSGFYKILVPLNWTGIIKENLSDLRIVDDKEKTVPFIIEQSSSPTSPYFLTFPILSNSTDSTHTILDIDARGKQGTDHLSLVMSNSSAERYISLSGSDNREQWFIIDENILLKNADNNSESQFAQQINFPFIRYPFLRLKINNRSYDPLNILKTGVLVNISSKENSDFFLNPEVVFSQTDSADGNSYIWISNTQIFPIDRIRMILLGERYYKRQVDVFSAPERRKSQLLASIKIVSGKEPIIELQRAKESQLLVVIYNGDNPPLKVGSINTEIKKDYLIAFLEKGKTYHLIGGNRSANPPQYDLSYFKDSIPQNLAVIEPGKPSPYNKDVNKAEGNNKWWLWPLIIAMLAILALLTFKMAREVK